MNRKLLLNTEHLAELSPDELVDVAGGDVTGDGLLCVTQWPSCLDDRCPTLTCG